MPNRIIREAILSSERMALLGWPDEVFYRRLMSIVDDYGRTEANPQLLRARCYPLQIDTVRTADITRWMAECQKAGLILGYVVDGKQYVEVLNFGQQQRSASKWPPPPGSASKCAQVIAPAHVFGVVVGDEKDTHTAGEALPENFALPKPWGQWAIEECPHWTAETVRAIAAQFADHHRAKGTLSLDWQATWRLWCRDPLTQKAHPPPKADKPTPLPSNTVPQSQASIAADAARKAEDMQRQAEIRAQTPEQRAEHTRIARETAERLKQRQAA